MTKYRIGKLLEVFSEDGQKKVTMNKGSDKYRVLLFQKKHGRGWVSTKSREAKYKKYAERRFVELCEELKE